MSTDFELVATSREDIGKGASRRLRRIQGLIPGVVYGGKKAAKSITLSHDMIIHALEKEGFASSILSLKIDKTRAEKVIVKDLQRHPFKPKVLHIDFKRVSANVAVNMYVPLHLTGEAAGLKEGGVLAQAINELEVTCLPKDLPESVEYDITELELNAAVRLSDIKLPENVVLTQFQTEEDEDQMVANITVPKVVAEPEEVVAEGEEAEGEAAEGDATEAKADDAAEDKKDGE